MADLIRTFSSILGKITAQPGATPSEGAEAAHENVPVATEAELAAFSPEELQAYMATQPERAAMRVVSSLSDPALQLRVVQAITDEAALKRISRSELDKKVKRAADKKLREADTSDTELKLRNLVPLNERMRTFFATPRWAEGDELLAHAHASDLIEGAFDESHSLYVDFLDLRGRLERMMQGYDAAGAELESIVAALDPSHPRRPSKQDIARMQERWQELTEKYSPLRDPGVADRYEAVLAARNAPRPPKSRKPAEAAQASAQPESPEAAQAAAEARRAQQEKDQKAAQDAQRERARKIDKLFARAQKLQGQLENRHARGNLRELHREVDALRRWKREFPQKLDELDALLKTIANQRTEAVEATQWDTWARTDRARRIQAELEAGITGLENEQDPEAALLGSVGLAEKLREFAGEMRELGKLKRDQDQKIWDQFKAVSDRGWALLDRVRLILFEKAQTLFAEHASKSLEAEPIQFKGTAFAGEVPAQVRELRLRWVEIGAGKPTDENRRLEKQFNRLFETYSRQLNLSLGRKQKSEAQAVQNAREVLNEMRSCAEGKATLLSRARVAKGLDEKWRRASLPAATAEALQSEWAGYQAKLQEQLAAESAAFAERLDALSAKLRGEPDRKAVPELETELQSIQKQASQLKELMPEPQAYSEAHARASALLQEYKTKLAQETQARALERDRVLEEAQALALSSDWDATRARFEELKALWKKVGSLGQKQDASYARLFDSCAAFFQGRFDRRDQSQDASAQAKGLKARSELVYSLEALLRFRQGAKPAQAPDLSELGGNPAGQLLQFGMKYKQILGLDPAGGAGKETLKVMDQWGKLGWTDDEAHRKLWRHYLARVRALLDLA